METKIMEIDEHNINMEKLQEAADVLIKSGLVVFPTETVYGLGAAAVYPRAVRGIFAAKGRPADNPLIVHVADREMAKGLVRDHSVLGKPDIVKLTESFWPGPLTIIFEKSGSLCEEVSAGLSTVGIRMPANKIALELIKLAGTGIAAPSANSSGRPSPTRPEHVIEDMNGKVDVIINGGCSLVGVESTVLDMTCEPPVILRPGGVTRENIEAALGRSVLMSKDIQAAENDSFIPKAPGMKYRHYAPKGKLIIFCGEEEKVAAEIIKQFDEAVKNGINSHIIASKQTICYYIGKNAIVLGDKNKPETFAADLFAALRYCDECGAQVILAEAVAAEGIGEAVMNRLIKAAGNTVIYV